MTNEFVQKMSYERQNLKLKVTYEIECNSQSGELVFGDLIDVINVEETDQNQNNQLEVINRFLSSGHELKKTQIKELCKRNIAMLASNYKQDPIGVKRIIKSTPSKIAAGGLLIAIKVNDPAPSAPAITLQTSS